MSDRPALGTLVLPVQCLACRRLWEVRVPQPLKVEVFLELTQQHTDRGCPVCKAGRETLRIGWRQHDGGAGRH